MVHCGFCGHRGVRAAVMSPGTSLPERYSKCLRCQAEADQGAR